MASVSKEWLPCSCQHPLVPSQKSCIPCRWPCPGSHTGKAVWESPLCLLQNPESGREAAHTVAGAPTKRKPLLPRWPPGNSGSALVPRVLPLTSMLSVECPGCCRPGSEAVRGAESSHHGRCHLPGVCADWGPRLWQNHHHQVHCRHVDNHEEEGCPLCTHR